MAYAGSSRLNQGRVNAFRLGPDVVSVIIGGVESNSKIIASSIRIEDIRNDAPNLCSFTYHDPSRATAPVAGQSVFISKSATGVEFAGTITVADQVQIGRQENVAYNVTCSDYTFLLGRRRPIAAYTNALPESVVLDLVSRFSSGFSAHVHTPEDMPNVTVTFDGSQDLPACLTTVANLVGGYWYPDYYKVVHFFLTHPGDDPAPINDTNVLDINGAEVLSKAVDITQVRTRVYGKGVSVSLPTDIGAGESIVPVQNAANFNPSGGHVMMEGGPVEVDSYDSIQAGGGGAVVGPGAAPGSAPVVYGLNGSGLSLGVYKWAYTFVTSGTNETIPSPISDIVVTESAVAAPPLQPGLAIISSFSIGAGTYDMCYTYGVGGPYLPNTQNNLHTDRSPYSTMTVGSNEALSVQVYKSSDPNVKQIDVFRRINGAGDSAWHFVLSVPNEDTVCYPNVNLSGVQSISNTIGNLQQAVVHSISAGPSGTTKRNLYRTAANGSQLKLVTTINDNVTNQYTDSVADGSLGANAPTSDTSGLTAPSGQVLVGSTSLLTNGVSAFQSGGGWAVVSGQYIRYTGTSGTSLTGIPLFGPGSIITTIQYGATVTAVPALTGINSGAGVVSAMPKGTTVSLWVQRDDLTAQAAMAALEGGDGIHEFTVVDSSLTTDAALTARCVAELEQFSAAQIDIECVTRDVNARSGRTLTVNISSPTSISVSAVIQQVTSSQFELRTALPLRKVRAISARFSIQDLIRRVVLASGSATEHP